MSTIEAKKKYEMFIRELDAVKKKKEPLGSLWFAILWFWLPAAMLTGLYYLIIDPIGGLIAWAYPPVSAIMLIVVNVVLLRSKTAFLSSNFSAEYDLAIAYKENMAKTPELWIAFLLEVKNRSDSHTASLFWSDLK